MENPAWITPCSAKMRCTAPHRCSPGGSTHTSHTDSPPQPLTLEPQRSIPGHWGSDSTFSVRLHDDPVLGQLLLDENNFLHSFDNEIATCPKETRKSSPPGLGQCDRGKVSPPQQVPHAAAPWPTNRKGCWRRVDQGRYTEEPGGDTPGDTGTPVYTPPTSNTGQWKHRSLQIS